MSDIQRRLAEQLWRDEGQVGKFKIEGIKVSDNGTVYFKASCKTCGHYQSDFTIAKAKAEESSGNVICQNHGHHINPKADVPITAEQIRREEAQAFLDRERAAAAAKEAARLAAEQAAYEAALNAMRPDYNQFLHWQRLTGKPVLDFDTWIQQSDETRAKIMVRVRQGIAYERARSEFVPT